ncbi:MAG: hypothetical protein ACO3VF_00250 [Tamlana sp.]|jgi:hypothetical protein
MGNRDNKMVLERHCFDVDEDLVYIDGVLIQGQWEVARYYIAEGELEKDNDFFIYTIDFKVSGKVLVTDPNNGESSGSWLAYRNDGLNLGLYFGTNELFNQLNHRWKIVEVTSNRIELKDLSSTGAIERILVLEKKN